MNQGKGLTPIIVCSVIVAVVYLAVALLIPFLKTPSYWVAFSFGWIAILVAIAINVYVVKTSNTVQGVLYRSPLWIVSIIYLIVATIVSLGFMAVAFAPIWLIVLIQVVLAAVCAVVVIAGAHTASHIQSGEAATEQETAFIKSMRAQVNALEALAKTPEVKRAVASFAEALRYTDPITNPALYDFDQELAGLVAALRDALLAQDDPRALSFCAQAKEAIERRAAIVISLKKA